MKVQNLDEREINLSLQSAPLCVDLDGTLVHTDTLYESLLSALRYWRTWLYLPFWLLRGRAYLKHQLAEQSRIDAEVLPYNRDLLAYLEAEREAGRKLFLVTAADRKIAFKVAAHLNLFDNVLASDGVRNLKGAAKAAALVQHFGERGFAYAGDSKHDVAVWRHATSAVLVGVSASVEHAAAGLTRIEANIHARSSRLVAFLRAIRPHQWSKNLLVFVPIITSGAVFEINQWLRSLVLFIAFSATASAIYLFNDLADLEADRRHPRKRQRPFASGALPVTYGLTLAPMMIVFGLSMAAAVGGAHIIALYSLATVAYSLLFKELPLVDVFALAALYSVRLYGGGEVSGHAVSIWLLAFSSFLFLSLATVKRIGELMDMLKRGHHTMARRGYTPADIPIITLFGVCSSFCSSIVLAFYVQSREQLYSNPQLLWIIVPLILFWQCRLWLATARGYMKDDPIVYAAKDWVSWAAAASGAVLFLVLTLQG